MQPHLRGAEQRRAPERCPRGWAAPSRARRLRRLRGLSVPTGCQPRVQAAGSHLGSRQCRADRAIGLHFGATHQKRKLIKFCLKKKKKVKYSKLH